MSEQKNDQITHDMNDLLDAFDDFDDEGQQRTQQTSLNNALSESVQQDKTHSTATVDSNQGEEKAQISSLFQTASKKNISISKKLLDESRSKLNDGNRTSPAHKPSHNDDNRATSLFQTASKKKLSVSKDVLEKAEKAAAENDGERDSLNPARPADSGPSLSVQSPFQTASKKNVTVRKDSLQKAQEKAADTLEPEQKNTSINLSSFQTASKKTVTVNQDRIKEVQAKFNDEEQKQNGTTGSTASPSLFQTASKKKITVNQDRLKEAQAKFNDEGQTLREAQAKFSDEDRTTSNATNATTNPSLFQTASKKKITVNQDRLKEAQAKFNDEGQTLSNATNSTTNLSLFQTASKKTVTVNQDRLKEVQVKFNNEEQKQNGTPVTQTQKSAEKSENNGNSVASLFKTASSKKVKVNASRLKQATALLNDEADTSTNSTPPQSAPLQENTTPLNLFQTASKKKVNVKAKNLSKAAAQMSDVESPQNDTISPHVPSSEDSAKSAARPTPTRKRKRSASPSHQTPSGMKKKKSRFSHLQKNSPRPTSPSPKVIKNKATPRKSIKRTPRSFKSPRLSKSSMTLQAADRQKGGLHSFSKHFSDQRKAPSLQPLNAPSWLPKYGADNISSASNSDRPYISEYVKEKEPKHTVHELESLLSQLPDEIAYMTSESAAQFMFETKHISANFIALLRKALHVSEDEALPPFVSHEHFLKILAHLGAQETFITPQWVQNHYRWIVWKCGCTQRRFPQAFKDYLSVNQILSQLIYRYNCEYTRGQRSVLKKIFDTDTPSSVHMVLTVCSTGLFVDVSTIKMPMPEMDHPDEIIEVTDGWYSCKIGLDKALTISIKEGKIREGSKLRLCNGVMVGLEAACSPLEAPDLCFINYRINSVRRTKWDHPLGVQKSARGFRVNIASLQMEGGVVPQVQAVVQRRFPFLFMEKIEMPDGQAKRITRSAAAEEEASQAHRQKLESFIENNQEQIRSRLNEENAQLLREELQDVRPEEILDPDLIATMSQNGNFSLTAQQHEILSRMGSRVQMNRAEEVKKRLKELMEKQSITFERRVTPFFNVLMRDSCPYDRMRRRDSTFNDSRRLFKLTVWLATEDTYLSFCEGNHLRISSLDISKNSMDRLLNLKSTIHTRVEQLPCSEDDKKMVGYTDRVALPFPDFTSLVKDQSFDTFGHVLHVEEKVRIRHDYITKIYIGQANSDDLLLIKLEESDMRQSGWSPKQFQSYIFEHLSYVEFDHKSKLHICSAKIDANCTDSPELPSFRDALNICLEKSTQQTSHFRGLHDKVQTIVNRDPSHINTKKFFKKKNTLDSFLHNDSASATSTSVARSPVKEATGNLIIRERHPATVDVRTEATHFSYPIPSNMFNHPEELSCSANNQETDEMHDEEANSIPLDEQEAATKPTSMEQVASSLENAADDVTAVAQSSGNATESQSRCPQLHFNCSFDQGDKVSQVSFDSIQFAHLMERIFQMRTDMKEKCDWMREFVQFGVISTGQEDQFSRFIASHRQLSWTQMESIGDIFLSILTCACIVDRSLLANTTAPQPQNVDDFLNLVHSSVQFTKYQENSCKQKILFFEDEWEILVNQLCDFLEESMLRLTLGSLEKDADSGSSMHTVTGLEVQGFESIQDLFDMVDD